MARSVKTISNPPEVAAPLRRYYSNAVRVAAGADLLFIAGQVGLDVDGELVGKGDLRAQARQTLENIKAIVEANGGTMQSIVQVTVYVRDIKAFDEIRDIREEYFPEGGPTSAIVEISALALPDLLIEIAGIAALEPSS